MSMSDCDWVSSVAAVGTAIAAIVAAVGVLFAYWQLCTSKKIAQAQFEDGLAKEYRELTSGIPTKALLGEDLSESEYQDSFDELFRYVDLTNEQVSLRERGRISKKVWLYWLSGIQSNLRLPAFHRAWTEIKGKSKSFAELRRLENQGFKTDPRKWKTHLEEEKMKFIKGG
jgi:hypothetical protein